MQDVEEAGAMNADAMQPVAELGIGDGEDRPARGERPAGKAIDAGAGPCDPVAEAEAIEDGKAGRLEQQAGADRPRGVETLEDPDAMAGARQEQGRRHAGRPAADDRNVERDLPNHRPSLNRAGVCSQFQPWPVKAVPAPRQPNREMLTVAVG
jgi:hypothetical protein